MIRRLANKIKSVCVCIQERGCERTAAALYCSVSAVREPECTERRGQRQTGAVEARERHNGRRGRGDTKRCIGRLGGEVGSSLY
jgi:hypothetical protein